MSLRDRAPNLAASYDDLLKRIRHTGSVLIEDGAGKVYHSSNEFDVKQRKELIKAITDGEFS